LVTYFFFLIVNIPTHRAPGVRLFGYRSNSDRRARPERDRPYLTCV